MAKITIASLTSELSLVREQMRELNAKACTEIGVRDMEITSLKAHVAELQKRHTENQQIIASYVDRELQGPDVGQPAEKKVQVQTQPVNGEAQRIMDLKASGLQVVVKWDKVLEQMKFAISKVQFEKHIGRKPSERFLSSFEVHIKRTEDKFMFIPVTENEATLEFARDFVKAAKMMRLEVEVEGKKMVLKLDAGRKEGGGAWFRYTYK